MLADPARLTRNRDLRAGPSRQDRDEVLHRLLRRAVPHRRVPGARGLRLLRDRLRAAIPDLTRILLPDDYVGWPQRRDFPVGGEPVTFTYNERDYG